MGFSIVGTIIGLIIILPSIVFYLKYPPKNVPKNIKESNNVLTILEKLGQMGCLAVLIISKESFIITNINIYMILMLICIIIYYLLWTRYIINGRNYILMYAPILFIPVPLAVFPICSFIFTALWGKSILLGVASIILAIGHIGISWNIYRQIRGTK